MNEIFYKDESYKIIGICMEAHRLLGRGFRKIIYKDALQIEFNNAQINYLKASVMKLGLIVNFEEASLVHKRVVSNSCNPR